jgi:hypothetical protein
MNTVKIGKLFPVTLELYDDIDSMPIDVFSRFNKYLLIESSIGSTLHDIDKNHLAVLYRVAGDKAKSVAELNNLRQLIHFIISEVNVTHMAFACLIASIDGKPITDYSEGNLKSILAMLAKKGLTQETVKKKLQTGKQTFTGRLPNYSLIRWMKVRRKTIIKTSKG